MPRSLAERSLTRADLKSAALASLLITVTSRLVLLLTSVLLARWLGASDFGIYAYAVSILMLLNTFAQLGLPTLLVRLTPAYSAGNHWSLVHGLVQSAFIAVAGAALLLALLGTLLVLTAGESLPPEHSSTLLWAMAILPVLALIYVASATLRGLHYVIAGQLTDTMLVPLFFLALVLILLFVDFQVPALQSTMAARFIAVAVTLGAAAWFLAQRMPSEVTQAAAGYDRATWTRAAVPLVFVGTMTMVNTQTDVLMLAAVHGPTSAGIYQAAARGSELVAFSLFMLTPVVQPSIARLYALRQLDDLQRLITMTARVASTSSLLVAIALIVFSSPVLRVVYGPEFEKGASALSLLCAAQVVNVASGLVGQVLIMTGHEKDAAIGLALGAFTNVALNALLIPAWHINGAAAATGVSLIVWNLFLLNRVRTRTGLHTGVLRLTSLR